MRISTAARVGRVIQACWVFFFLILLFKPHAELRGAERIAGTPPNANGDVGEQSEKDWIDNRWARTQVGQFLASLVETPNGTVAKGFSVKVGSNDEGTVCIDTAKLCWRAAWMGGFLKFDAARFGLIRVPKIDGAVAFSMAPATGWPMPHTICATAKARLMVA